MEGFLKGADAVVLAAATRLNLRADIHPIWKDEDLESDDMHPIWQDQDAERDDNEAKSSVHGEVVGDKFDFQMTSYLLDDEFHERLHGEVNAAYPLEDITWCTSDRRAWAEDHVVATYGNEPSTTTVYNAAAILIHVPAWSTRKLLSD